MDPDTNPEEVPDPRSYRHRGATPEKHSVRRGQLRRRIGVGAQRAGTNPYSHAPMADKRNLVLLSDPEGLAAIGVEPRLRAALPTVSRTVVVKAANAEDLWRERKRLFFKPMRGYGSKAVYLGEKATRSVLEEILKGEYVA